MSKKSIWSWLTPILILAGMVAGFSLLVYFGRKAKSAVKKDGIETIATVYDEGKRMIKLSYQVNGNTITNAVGKGYSNIEDGEQFYMKYSSDDNKSIVVYFNRPYISDIIEYLETNCTSLEKTLSIISFEYILDGKKYRRKTIDNEHNLNPENYVVKYQLNNPKIGYLFKIEE